MPWHVNQLLNPEYTRVDLVKEGANSQAHIKLFKSKGGGLMNIQELLSKMKPEHASIVTEAIEKAKTDAQADVATQIADLEKAKKDAEDALIIQKGKTEGTTEEDILKSVQDPAVRTFLEKQMAKTAAAEAAIRKAKEEQLEAEAIAKAKEVPAVGATTEQIADIYKGLADKPEIRETVFGIFKAASAMSAESTAFQEVGKSAASADNATSADAAWDQIEKAAKVFEGQGLTAAQAVTKAINENPELYSAYIANQK